MIDFEYTDAMHKYIRTHPCIHKAAFSLVELSIVLVILGLLVGGVLSGQALIRSATIRAQIAQIDQYKVAARAFRDKYFYLPGDMPGSIATPLGLPSRSSNPAAADGDGDGLITGYGWALQGEVVAFWADMSRLGFIPGSYLYNNGGAVAPGYNLPAQTGDALAQYLPRAKLGNDLFISMWNGGVSPNIWMSPYTANDGINYMNVGAITNAGGYAAVGATGSAMGIKVIDAYNIDSKIDDGRPQTGSVVTSYIGGQIGKWAGASGALGVNDKPNTQPTAGSSTTCYDNNNVNGQPQLYSVGQANGEGANCTLSFKL